MTQLDPRTPVLVGVGQLTHRPAEPEGQPSPAEMMVEALHLAADDAGPGRALLERAGSVQVVDPIGWRTTGLAGLVARGIGARPAEVLRSTTGGNTPQYLVNRTAGLIRDGRLDVAVIAGAEAMYTRTLARKRGVELTWEREAGEEDERVGLDRAGNHDAELARGLAVPTQIYPLFENALRAAAGRALDDHLALIGRLWSRFSHVAAGNPHAWSPTPMSAEEIVTPSASNRMVAFPYTKLLCANIQVDQAAALVLCSAEAAEAAGVPRDRWVFPLAGADANDHWFVSERANLHSSPAIGACGRTAFALAGMGVDDVALVDLYSCFPSAVQIGAAELGLDLFDPRELTVTGGLVFGGGPGNNYVTHSIATMASRLRALEEGATGLVTANGWFVTKHSVGLYSTRPPSGGFRAASAQAEVDATPRRDVAADHDGPVTVETFTVVHERDGQPSLAFVACLTPDGRRAWGTTADPGAMKTLETADVVGAPATLRGDGTVELS